MIESAVLKGNSLEVYVHGSCIGLEPHPYQTIVLASFGCSRRDLDKYLDNYNSMIKAPAALQEQVLASVPTRYAGQHFDETVQVPLASVPAAPGRYYVLLAGDRNGHVRSHYDVTGALRSYLKLRSKTQPGRTTGAHN